MPLKKNTEETFPVMLCHYMDKGDTDTFSIKIKNKTKQKRVYIKKKNTLDLHIDLWPKITEFLTLRAICIS